MFIDYNIFSSKISECKVKYERLIEDADKSILKSSK
jgi:hypothetical protein